jgi:hypothetical protein
MSEGSKATHRRRRRKPAPAPAAVVEPEPTNSRPPDKAPATEATFFVYTYTVWNRFPNARDN